MTAKAGDETPAKRTSMVPRKLKPINVTMVPGGPLVGANPRIVRASTVKSGPLPLPDGVVTATGPVTAATATVNVRVRSSITVNGLGAPPTVTLVAPLK